MEDDVTATHMYVFFVTDTLFLHSHFISRLVLDRRHDSEYCITAWLQIH